MKIYQVNFSDGRIHWYSNNTEAGEFGNLYVEELNKVGKNGDYEVIPVEVPLLKPQFLEWLNAMFGGEQHG